MMTPYLAALISKEITRAETSSLHLWILNKLLLHVIPFNRPHGLKVVKTSRTHEDVSLPFRKQNQNHVGGLHACALATCAEYSAGLLLLYNFRPDQYRLLLKKLDISFERQARAGVMARCTIEANQLLALNENLTDNGSTFISLSVEVRDNQNEVVCRLQVDWQIKLWEQVRSHSTS